MALSSTPSRLNFFGRPMLPPTIKPKFLGLREASLDESIA
jgi:hypothetical protein